MITGSCHCKSVSFSLDCSSLSVRRCYCETCRKLSGADYASVAKVPRETFSITSGAGHLVSYESLSGKQRYYCGHCFSPIHVTNNHEPDFIRVRTGLLDGDPNVEVTGHIWVGEKPSWVAIEDDKPRYLARYNGPADPT